MLLSANGSTAVEPTDAPQVRLLVPAYFYPAGKGLEEWERLIGSAKQVPTIAIVNPDSGPGKKVDPNYTAVVKRARKAGVTLVGYVTTQYAKRPLADVKAEVDTWVRFYPEIQGIHMDEQASGADKVAYYAELYEFAKRTIPKALAIGNPGTVCAEAYVSKPGADAVCVFERDQGFADFRPPAWAARYPARRFAVVLYHVDSAERMRKDVNGAVRKRIGNLFITDAQGANPYDRLPTYWDAEVATVQRANQAKTR